MLPPASACRQTSPEARPAALQAAVVRVRRHAAGGVRCSRERSKAGLAAAIGYDDKRRTTGSSDGCGCACRSGACDADVGHDKGRVVDTAVGPCGSCGRGDRDSAAKRPGWRSGAAAAATGAANMDGDRPHRRVNRCPPFAITAIVVRVGNSTNMARRAVVTCKGSTALLNLYVRTNK
jgi:hypothetical protein